MDNHGNRGPTALPIWPVSDGAARGFGWKWHVHWLLAFVSFMTLIFWALVQAPEEARMGVVYRILYVHAPSAYAMYVGFAVCAGGSLVYLLKRKTWGDIIAEAGAEVGLLFALIVLTTGPLWARKAWGVYWVWDHRLTTTVLATLIFAAYLGLRGSSPGHAERRFSAAMALIGLCILPVIHYSVQLWRGQHPTVISDKGGGLAHPDMKLALGLGFLAMTLLVSLLLTTRSRIGVYAACVEELEMDALEAEDG